MVRLIASLAMLAGLAACGGGDVIKQSCDEPQRYQSVVAGKRVEAPEGLDALNEFAEMPIPKAEGAPVRPPGSRCIELPPAAGTSK
ncbi:MAG: hypothetical protein KJO01_08240 [Gammaproteobacteria bacterium]|nr:hypothetical protein [Gammaproteobacteria bacterium]